MNQKNTVQLLLGGNLGDRIKYLDLAVVYLKERIGNVTRKSNVYETEPWGFKNESSFLNQLVILKTELSPEQVLSNIKVIELEMGRTEKEIQWSSRIIDIDILFCGDSIVQTPDLTIPHPRLHERRFALEPLMEIDPSFMHPLLKKTVKELYAECCDQLQVKKYFLNAV